MQNRAAARWSTIGDLNGHAESGITCRGKAPRITNSWAASRRPWKKRSGGPHRFAHRKNGDTGRAREATGVSEGRSPQQMRFRDWDDNSPRNQAVPPKRFGRRETFDSSVEMGATHFVHTRRKPR